MATSPQPSRSFWRRRRDDVVLGSLGALVGAVSLTYPFCRDQALFAYVGRAWLHDGQVPYRDTFEQKTPFIFLLHGVLTLFSPNDVLALRVLEIALVLAAGWLAVLASRTADTPSAHGITGLTALASSTFYFVSLRFPDTGSCEMWGVVALLGCRALLARSAHRWAPAAAGLLAGIAVLAKPPMALLAIFVCLDAVRRSQSLHARLRLAGLFAAALALPSLLMVAYFVAVGAAPDAYDVLLRANAYYRLSENVSSSATDAVWSTLQGLRTFGPLIWLVVAPTFVVWLVAARTGNRDLAWRYGEPLGAMVLALVGVWSQLRFFPYHYVPLLVGFALAMARLTEDAVTIARDLAPFGASTCRTGLAAVTVLLQVVGGGDSVVEWTRRATNAAAFVTGALTRDALDDTFDIPGFFDEQDARRTARWLSANTAPDERVLVRGYEPEIYLLSSRRYGGRFFWSDWLTSPRRAYRREEWLAQDAGDFQRLAPTWVVALPPAPEPWTWDWFRARADLESAAFYEGRGFERRAAFGPYIILRRR
jgi:hypothetical protein